MRASVSRAPTRGRNRICVGGNPAAFALFFMHRARLNCLGSFGVGSGLHICGPQLASVAEQRSYPSIVTTLIYVAQSARDESKRS